MFVGPLTNLLQDSLSKTPIIQKLELFHGCSEKEFIQKRIEGYYSTLETAVKDGHNLNQAEEIATKAIMSGFEKK